MYTKSGSLSAGQHPGHPTPHTKAIVHDQPRRAAVKHACSVQFPAVPQRHATTIPGRTPRAEQGRLSRGQDSFLKHSGGLTNPSTMHPSYKPELGGSAAHCSPQHSRCLRLHVADALPYASNGLELQRYKLDVSVRFAGSSYLRVSLFRCHATDPLNSPHQGP